MVQEILYAYVDGADLDEVEAPLVAQLDAFVETTAWNPPVLTVVNQRHPRVPSQKPEDLPGWDLGLNLALSDDPAGDLSKLEAIVAMLRRLSDELKREFVVGLASVDGSANDILWIDSRGASPSELRMLLGVASSGG